MLSLRRGRSREDRALSGLVATGRESNEHQRTFTFAIVTGSPEAASARN